MPILRFSQQTHQERLILSFTWMVARIQDTDSFYPLSFSDYPHVAYLADAIVAMKDFNVLVLV